MLFAHGILKDAVHCTVYSIHNNPVCLGQRLGETAYRQLQLLCHTGYQKHRPGQREGDIAFLILCIYLNFLIVCISLFLLISLNMTSGTS